MWLILAGCSALFAGLTAILAKCGIKKTDSTLATAMRTIVVLIFAWIMVFIRGSQGEIASISTKTLIFLILSGLATGASWLCYFRALQKGNVNKVVPIDKSSTVLTMILAMIFFSEKLTVFKIVGIILITVGIFLMIEKKDVSDNGGEEKKGASWLVYAVLSAVFAALTSILGKVGIEGVESNLGTAIRTAVVLVMSWIMVFATGKQSGIKELDRKETLFIALSGLATGASWLCYYRALQEGITTVVVAIDKMSIIVTVLFAFLVFKEKMSKKSFVGLVTMILGTAVMVCELFI